MFRSVVAAGLIALWLVAPARAQEPGAQEKQRQQLLDQLGLKKRPPLPKADPAVTADPVPVRNDTAEGADPARPAADPAAVEAAPGFLGPVHQLLIRGCQACHAEGGVAGKTGFSLSGNLRDDYDSVRRFVTAGKPAASALPRKAAGEAHGGGSVYARGSAQSAAIERWIAGGANYSGARLRVALPPARATPAPRPRLLRPAIVPSPPVAAAPTPSGVAPGPGSSATPDAEHPEDPAVYYLPAVHPILVSTCGTCHAAEGVAGATAFVLTGDPNTDFYTVVAFVDVAAAGKSVLVNKALGRQHGGGAVLTENSEALGSIVAWIEGGAHGPSAPPPVAHDRKAWSAPPAQPEERPPGAPERGARPSGMAPAPVGRLNFPGGLRLNGRFDLNYERRGIGDTQPGGGRDALANYHRFVFLTRETADDPFGFTAELLSLQMWQVHMRIAPEAVPIKLWLKAGKLLVPFGAEPLFHQYYGGHGGFDQRVLPIIWAKEGVAAHLFHRRGGLSLTWDVYAVRGHHLRAADAVLNLQNDFSSEDDVRFGYGQRLGAAWGPVSAYYSAYANRLGYERMLFMQAFDVTTAQWHGVPVLERFTAGVGLLRADVSGGGAGRDYYHFASYLRLRFFILRSLYLQYGQGLRTINNRRNLIGDSTRWGAEDGSTHNLALWGRYRGVSMGVAYFVNFEKADEVDDDLFRVTVAYEF